MAIMKRRNINKASKPSTSDVLDISSPNELLKKADESGLDLKPLNINGLISLLNIGLRIHPMEDQKSGYIKQEEGRWVIGVNSLHHPNRQRFTMAHELGHYVLHRDQIGEGLEDTILFRAESYGEPGIEREANEFASLLLMPEDYFRETVNECNGEIKTISKKMKVSALAVSYRAKSLGYKEAE